MSKAERILFLIATWGPRCLSLSEVAELYDSVVKAPSLASVVDARQEGAAALALQAFTKAKPEWMVHAGVFD